MRKKKRQKKNVEWTANLTSRNDIHIYFDTNENHHMCSKCSCLMFRCFSKRDFLNFELILLISCRKR